MKPKVKSLVPDLPADQMRRHLRVWRLSVDWTQYDLAKKTGLSQSQISLYERGDASLGDADLAKIWRALTERDAGRKQKLGTMRDLLSARFPTATFKSERRASPDADEIRQRKLNRQRAGLSQHELSRKIGISQGKLSDFENGKVQLTSEQTQKWQRELMVKDPWFRLEAMSDAGKEMQQLNEKLAAENAALRTELNTLRAQFMNCEQLSTLRYAQIQELAERLERLQSPLVKGNK